MKRVLRYRAETRFVGLQVDMDWSKGMQKNETDYSGNLVCKQNRFVGLDNEMSLAGLPLVRSLPSFLIFLVSFLLYSFKILKQSQSSLSW